MMASIPIRDIIKVVRKIKRNLERFDWLSLKTKKIENIIVIKKSGEIIFITFAKKLYIPRYVLDLN